eukprot:1281280-Rhodomonas_salina.2
MSCLVRRRVHVPARIQPLDDQFWGPLCCRVLLRLQRHEPRICPWARPSRHGMHFAGPSSSLRSTKRGT